MLGHLDVFVTKVCDHDPISGNPPRRVMMRLNAIRSAIDSASPAGEYRSVNGFTDGPGVGTM